MKYFLKILNPIKAPLIITCAISTTVAYSNEYYGSFGIDNTILTDKTYDWNEDHYPYKFSTDVMSFRAEAGKHINDKFDLGFELMTTSNFSHKYNGPIEPNYDGIPGINFTALSQEPKVYASQQIKSTTLLLQGKYKYRPYFFSNDANIYGRTGVGLAFNRSSYYIRNIMQSLEVIYPANTKTNLGLSIGGGFEKQVGKAKFGIGYDCYSVGSFQTKKQAYIKDFSTGIESVQVAKDDEIIGKQLRPANTLLHSINISVSFDF